MMSTDPGRAAAVAATSTVGAALADAAAVLAHRGRFAPRDAADEANDIVAALHDVPRFWPRMHRDAPLDRAMRDRVLHAAARRERGAPLAYAVGRAAFRHLSLDVDERVLIPRPETEQLVELVLDLARGAPGSGAPGSGGRAVDVGTGSGAIALALASEGCFSEVIATDVSRDALAVAGANAARLEQSGALRAPVHFEHGTLLAPLLARGTRARVVVSNPPYIAHDEARALPRDVRDWEPPLALYSGGQGLDVTARLVSEACRVLEPGGVLALEVDARRASLVAELVAGAAAFAGVAVRLDLAGRERFVLATLR